MYTSISLEIQNQKASIFLNRPAVFNSINHELALELIEALKRVQSDPEVRAILISGSGTAFSAGQDLKEASEITDEKTYQKIIFEGYNEIVKLIRRIEKPVVAGVNGIAAGAGAGIALACDLVIASQKASFIQAFSKIGLVPDTGATYFLPRLVGFQKALALTLLGEPVTATEAEKMGMIYKCFPEEEFQIQLEKIMDKLSQMPTKALGKTKILYHQSFENTLEEQLILEGEYQLKMIATQDAKEGVRAFTEKRKPIFKGQ